MFKKLSFFFIIISAICATHLAFAKTALPPSFIYLTWESDSTVPAAYNGKDLLVRDSVLKLTVQPFIYSSGAYLNAKNLNYKWSVNGESKKSGQGITTFRYLIPSVLEETTQIIKVEVFSGVMPIGEKAVNILVIDPKVILTPLANTFLIRGGILEANASNNLQIKAIPYFFSPTEQNQLKVSWWLNNEKKSSDSSDKYVFTISKPQQSANEIMAVIERLDDVFVRGKGQLQIKFTGL